MRISSIFGIAAIGALSIHSALSAETVRPVRLSVTAAPGAVGVQGGYDFTDHLGVQLDGLYPSSGRLEQDEAGLNSTECPAVYCRERRTTSPMALAALVYRPADSGFRFNFTIGRAGQAVTEGDEYFAVGPQGQILFERAGRPGNPLFSYRIERSAFAMVGPGVAYHFALSERMYASLGLTVLASGPARTTVQFRPNPVGLMQSAPVDPLALFTERLILENREDPSHPPVRFLLQLGVGVRL